MNSTILALRVKVYKSSQATVMCIVNSTSHNAAATQIAMGNFFLSDYTDVQSTLGSNSAAGDSYQSLRFENLGISNFRPQQVSLNPH